METRHVENADAVGRTSAAVRSLSQWYQRDAEILLRAKLIARQHIAAGQGDIEHTRMSLAEIEEQERELHAHWENSSLRRFVDEWSILPCAGVESRVALAPAGGPGPAVVGRATETARNTTVKTIQGYAAVFGKPSVDLGGFVERIEPGAFTEAIKTSDVRCLFNHDPNYLFARSTSATLELKEDSHGLHFRAYLLAFDGPSYHLARLIDRADLTACSFSFSDVTDRWQLARKPADLDVRIIERIGKLYDVGPVIYPAYPSTSVSATFAKAERAAPALDAGLGDDDLIEPPAQTRPRTISPARQRQLDQNLAAVERKLSDMTARYERQRQYSLPWTPKTW